MSAPVTAVPAQGDIWWAETEDKRRPVLVVTRTDAVPVLGAVVVAPVTRTIRGIDTEVRLGPRHGLREDCVASFDNLVPVRRSHLTQRVGRLGPEDATDICRALRAVADC